MDNSKVEKVHKGSLILINWLTGIIGIDMVTQIMLSSNGVCPSNVRHSRVYFATLCTEDSLFL